MAIEFYQEKESGDYLSVDTDQPYGSGCYWSYAVNTMSVPESIGPCVVAKVYLDLHCQRVPWEDIPVEWLVRLHKPDGVPAN